MSTTKPVSTRGDAARSSKQAQASEALQLMQQALSLIDQAEGPDDAGAHLDFAITRLNEWLERGGAES